LKGDAKALVAVPGLVPPSNSSALQYSGRSHCACFGQGAFWLRRTTCAVHHQYLARVGGTRRGAVQSDCKWRELCCFLDGELGNHSPFDDVHIQQAIDRDSDRDVNRHRRYRLDYSDKPAPRGGTSNVSYLPVANAVSTIKMVSLSSTVGTAPLGAAEGDFNGDRILDLAVSNDGSANVTILLGNGDGTFVTHGTYAVGSMPLDLAVADVNGDGHLDLVVGHDTTFGPSILLGDGTGTFVLQPALTTIANPERPMVADIDHDGRLDIVVGSFNGTGGVFALSRPTICLRASTMEVTIVRTTCASALACFIDSTKSDRPPVPVERLEGSKRPTD
jgi:hypothetical protein